MCCKVFNRISSNSPKENFHPLPLCKAGGASLQTIRRVSGSGKLNYCQVEIRWLTGIENKNEGKMCASNLKHLSLQIKLDDSWWDLYICNYYNYYKTHNHNYVKFFLWWKLLVYFYYCKHDTCVLVHGGVNRSSWLMKEI